eukprot:TRINITY_DN14596_c0_g2_i22.p1 TRINITY_DN14596_c0_g2~~TRINITY_DN14596_c0_g2_i22.p1  ORF type:complete len:216 (-),score=32.56 TRINITY_DN14596_c0_g2_i22:203-850(-)
MGLNQSETERIELARTGYYSTPKTFLNPIEEESEADLVEDEVLNIPSVQAQTLNKERRKYIQIIPKGRLVRCISRIAPVKISFKKTPKISLPILVQSEETSPSSASSKKSYGFNCSSIDEVCRDRRLYAQDSACTRTPQVLFSGAKDREAKCEEVKVVRLRKNPSCGVIQKPVVSGVKVRIRKRNSSVLNRKAVDGLVPLMELLKVSSNAASCGS